ncbi:hypothetical protein ES707_22336 [subsurface metagenome]
MRIYDTNLGGDRCNKRLHLQVCKGLHLVARRFTVIADFQVDKNRHWNKLNQDDTKMIPR